MLQKSDSTGRGDPASFGCHAGSIRGTATSTPNDEAPHRRTLEATVIEKSMIYSLGDRHPRIHPSCYIAPSADVMGSVVMEAESSVWFQCVLRGDNDPITIGPRTNIQDGCVLHTDVGVPLTLGAGVTIGHKVMLHGCEVGDGSLIGINAVVLNRARIGKHCLIGANSLITEGKEIPDYSVVMGSPGKIVRTGDEELAKVLAINADIYVQNAARYRKQLEIEGERET